MQATKLRDETLDGGETRLIEFLETPQTFWVVTGRGEQNTAA